LRDIEADKPVEIPSKRKKPSSQSSASTRSPQALVPVKLQRPGEYLYGKLNIGDFVQKLSALGIKDARVEEVSTGSSIIHLVSSTKVKSKGYLSNLRISCFLFQESAETLIQVEDVQTHIVCLEGTEKGRELVRQRIKDALLTCLHKF
jgi:hypothetical protein